MALRPESIAARHELAIVLARELAREEEAQRLLRATLKLAPEDTHLHNHFALYLGRSGRPDEEEQTYRKILEIDPNDPTALKNLAIHLSTGQDGRFYYQEALEFARRAAEAAPEDPDVHYLLAQILHPQGLKEEAFKAMRRATVLDPDNAEYQQFLGYRLLRAVGDLDGAENALLRSLEIDENSAESYRGLAEVLLLQGLKEEALKAMRRATVLDPDNAEYQQYLGYPLLTAVGDLDGAENALLRSLEIDENSAESYRGLAEVLLFKDLCEKALPVIQKALDLNPHDSRAHVVLGSIHANQERYGDAEDAYRRSLDIEEGAEAWSFLARVLQKQDQNKASIDAYEHSLRLDPDQIMTLYVVGSLCLEDRELEHALEIHRRMAKLDEKSALTQCLQGEILMQQERFVEAESFFRKAHSTDSNPIPLNWIGRSLLAQNLYLEASEIFREQVKIDPGRCITHHQLGDALSKAGRLEDAADQFGKAWLLDPSHTKHLRELERVLSAIGDARGTRQAAGWKSGLGPEGAGIRNDLSWMLATTAQDEHRYPLAALWYAEQAVKLDPANDEYWTTLGVARYRAGDWDGSVQALDKASELRGQGSAIDWFFFALAYQQLDDPQEARRWYDLAVERVKEQEDQDEELARFQAEAAELLGVERDY